MDNSSISAGPGGTTFAGHDAVHLYRAMVIRSGLKLLGKGIKPTRGATITGYLKLITAYTGQRYKRTESERAIHDLTVWIETMKSAIPVESEVAP